MIERGDTVVISKGAGKEYVVEMVCVALEHTTEEDMARYMKEYLGKANGRVYLQEHFNLYLLNEKRIYVDLPYKELHLGVDGELSPKIIRELT